jgi:tRNA(Leu) C34 or U34 (ribose-2'-O)-methylase TrmL
MRGFAAIGLTRPKHEENVGSVLRAAYCYDVAMVAIQGDRTKVRVSTDTPKAWRHLPVLRGDDLRALVPYDAIPVAVDLVDGAEELQNFAHPQRAFYVFGPEDGTITNEVLSWCPRRVMIPTRTCMNLAATVNVILYDRLAKAMRSKSSALSSVPASELGLSAPSGLGTPQSSSGMRQGARVSATTALAG